MVRRGRVDWASQRWMACSLTVMPPGGPLGGLAVGVGGGTGAHPRCPLLEAVKAVIGEVVLEAPEHQDVSIDTPMRQMSMVVPARALA